MDNRQFLSGLVTALMVMSTGMSVYAVEPADTVAINAKIYTVNPKQPWAEAIAIDGTDIVYGKKLRVAS